MVNHPAYSSLSKNPYEGSMIRRIVITSTSPTKVYNQRRVGKYGVEYLECKGEIFAIGFQSVAKYIRGLYEH